MIKKTVLNLMVLGMCSAHAAEKPNILLIMIDDLNQMVGCFDGPAVTPNIDKLAASGVKFSNAYSACPSCNPSRTSMMVGQRPENNGVFNNSQHFRETAPAKDMITFPQLLKANGYNTIAAGKIFHGRSKPIKEGAYDQSDPVSWTYQPVIDGGLFFGAKEDKPHLNDETRLPCWVHRTTGTNNLTKADRKNLKSTWTYGRITVEPSNTLDFNTTEFGRDWLLQDQSNPQVKAAPKPDDKPFLLACGIFRPHIPILAPQEFFDLYETEEHKHRLELPDLPADEIADIPKAANLGNHWYVKFLKDYPEEQKNLRHAYLAASSYADAAAGIVLDALDKSPYADNTVVILMGDHGYHLGEKDRLGKSAVWQRASGMPMVIRMPKGKSGRAESPVNMLDIYPTILELTGLEAPQQMDGISLIPQLKNPEMKRDVPSVITSPNGKQIGVAKDQWLYINYPDGSEELYDHDKDPMEFKNLMHPSNFKEKYRAIADQLKKHIPENRKM